VKYNFLQALASGRVSLMDGAMGTELQRAGLRPGECCEMWNLTQHDRVLAIHQAYVAAGAQVLLTNTFQANPTALSRHGLADKLEALCQAAVQAARQACGPNGYVLGDIGPYEGESHELGRMVDALDGVDGLLLETLSSPRQLQQLVEILGRRSSQPAVFASFTFCRNPADQLTTVDGTDIEYVARQASSCGIDALGVNCGRNISMADMVTIVRRYRSETALPLFARPNAGTPRQSDGHWLYPRTPAEMAAELPELLSAGVSMVGGCCGTTPKHIAAFQGVVDAWNAARGCA
jgi:5-methyltetrahydrofolate--homocysteine methyltransferase